MICMQITHIIKNNFFLAFKRVFYVIINLKNIQTGFKIISLVLYNPEKVIGNLDFKLHTPTPSNSCLTNFTFINLNMPYIVKNVVQSFINLKNKITKHQNNFFIHLYKLVDTQTKSIFKLAHKMILLEVENKTFYTANELFSKRKKIKKTCVRIE